MPVRRDERGLTTLEWLLIVAAVAGLAALAVVIVSSFVDDTAEEIADADPLYNAGLLAADSIDRRAASHPTSDFPDRPAYRRLLEYYTRKCEELNTLYHHLPGYETRWTAPPAPFWDTDGSTTYLDKNVDYWQLSFARQDGYSMAGCRVFVDGKQASPRLLRGYHSVARGGERIRNYYNLWTWVPDLDSLSTEDQQLLASLDH